MPFGDRTGPMGLGPMTGRAAGYCAGFGVPGFMNPWFGVGRRWFGRGRGGGRGWRNLFYATGLPGWQRAAWGWPAWGFPPGYGPAYAAAVPPAPPSKEQELQMLKRQADWLGAALEEIKKRMDELSAQGPATT